jgi:predicted ATPase
VTALTEKPEVADVVEGLGSVAVVGAGTLFKVAIPGLTKAGSLIFQKLVRIRQVATAIEGIEADPSAAKAMSDFQIVKGSWRGEFDETVAKFLKSLEASGLNKLMFTEALVAKRSSSIKRTFIELFCKETGQDKDNAILLYEQIATSFEVTAKHITKDPALADIIRSSFASLNSDINRLETAIETVLEGIKLGVSSKDTDDILPKLIRAAVSEFRTLRVETSQGRKDVDINKIYIAPRLTFRQIDVARPLIQSAVDALATESASEDQSLKAYHEKMEQKRLEDQLQASSIGDMETLSRVLILGNPGGGKSTLLQSVCYRTATESLRQLNEGQSLGSVRLPIRVILRDFERARLAQPQLSLFEYIQNEVLHSAYLDRSLLERVLKSLLASGRVLLAFDGLDEILRTANRRQFVDLVNKFVEQFPLCQVIVSSREVGYDKAPLPEHLYEELILGDFVDEDVKQYAERFARNVAKKKLVDARASANKFMSQTSNNAADLRRNPLMLGLMMWIFNIRDDVPSNRPEIYQECSRLMFERWDNERNIIVDLPQTFDRLQVFSYLASKVFTDDELAGGVSSKWIETEIRRHLGEVLESQSQAHAAASALVQFIVDRSWVMSEKGEGVFSFTHQTFLEYFFAKFIDDSFDTVREIFDHLINKIIEEEWDVVSRLAFQIKTHRNRRKQDELVELLTGAMRNAELLTSQRQALTTFSARCLEFLVGSESKVREFIVCILDSCKTLYALEATEVMDSIPLLYQGAQERRPFIDDVFKNFLKSTFAIGSDKDREFVIACVDGWIENYGVEDRASAECRAVPAHAAPSCRQILTETLLQEVESNPASARTLFEWTGTVPTVALRKFGIAFLHFARPPISIRVDGLSALALAASGRYVNFFEDSCFSKKKAEASLEIIGRYWRDSGGPSIQPFPRTRELNNPPDQVWLELLKSVRAGKNLRLGMIAAFLAESKNQGRMYERPDMPGRPVHRQLIAYRKAYVQANDPEAAELVQYAIDTLDLARAGRASLMTAEAVAL